MHGRDLGQSHEGSGAWPVGGAGLGVQAEWVEVKYQLN